MASNANGERGAGPPLPIRVVGRLLTEGIARVPGAWRVVRRPMERYFANLAPGWDERVVAHGEQHLAPLVDAVERLDLAPRRILDVGTGTGAGALWLARRFADAEVLGVDVAPEMIALAEAKRDARTRFVVGDVAAIADEGPFDLITHLNCPVVFADVAGALAGGGTVLVAASAGPRTPFYTSHSVLRRGFRRVGLEVVGEGRAGIGTWFAAGRRR